LERNQHGPPLKIKKMMLYQNNDLNIVNIKDLKVVFAGCVLDCPSFLPGTIKNIRSYSKLFKESHTVIVENGSKDKTKEILNQNLSENDFFYLEKI
jgi:hypothetical protein